MHGVLRLKVSSLRGSLQFGVGNNIAGHTAANTFIFEIQHYIDLDIHRYIEIQTKKEDDNLIFE